MSAASALNDGAKKACGEILFFMHQDVCLWDKQAVKKIVGYLSDNKNSIVGAAGIAKFDGQRHYDLFMDRKKRKTAWGTGGKPLEAYTLDECFLAMYKSVWQELTFDENVCDGWHFYGADICYKNLLKGNTNVIFPLEILHDSYGNPSGKVFYRSAIKLAEKYDGKIYRLQTTCINAECSVKGVKRFFRKRRLLSLIKKTAKIFGLSRLVKKTENRMKSKKGLFVEEK